LEKPQGCADFALRYRLRGAGFHGTLGIEADFRAVGNRNRDAAFCGGGVRVVHLGKCS